MPGARARPLDAGDTLRQGVEIPAQLAHLRDYVAMQGQDQRHQPGQPGHPDTYHYHGNEFGVHRA